MRTIEQDLAGVSAMPVVFGDADRRGDARRAGEVPKALHDGVLPARDPLHSMHAMPIILRFSATISVVKDRILKKFEEEIAQLDKELKTELPREIKRARELGDLRENAEYQAAKERQRLVESRISLLQKRVSEIQLMNLEKIPKDKVGFGSTVTLREENGQTVVYQLVMPEDANVDEGLISTASPIGRALLNKEEGDDVLVRTPNGAERRFEVTKLVTIHG
jgi:transcription elongation factor GreA